MATHDFSSITNHFINQLIEKLENDGYATEGDFIEIYSVQYDEFLYIINQKLKSAGYSGEVLSLGSTYSGIAVYGLFDPTRINYDDAKQYLNKEGFRQVLEAAK